MSLANQAEAAAIFVYQKGLQRVFDMSHLPTSPLVNVEDVFWQERFQILFDRLVDPARTNNWNNVDYSNPISLLTGPNSDGNRKRYFKAISPFSPGLLCPTETTSKPITNELTRLKASFESELQAVVTKEQFPNAKVWRFLAEKYLSAVGVPVEIEGRHEPLPFYDLLHFIAALLPNPEGTKYWLATLDMSGIQDFVYNISSNKALQSLRGRSIFLELVAQTALQEILQAVNCTEDALLVRGGGSYTLLLPEPQVEQERQPLKDKLTQIIRKWNNRLLYWQEGRLFMAWAVNDNPISENGLVRTESGATDSEYGQARKELIEKISQVKSQKFSDVLSVADFEPTSPHTPCRICRRHVSEGVQLQQLETVTDEAYLICDLCRFLRRLGQRASRHASIELRNWGGNWQIVGGGEESVLKVGITELDKTINVKVCLNPQNATEVLGHDLELRVPVTERTVQTIEDEDQEKLAESSEGWSGLGAVRADVDNLGELMSKSLPQLPVIGQMSISRLLSLFFSTYLMRLNPDPSKAANDQTSQEKTEGAADSGQGVQQLRLANQWQDESDGTKRSEIGEAIPRSFVLIYGGGDDLFGLGSWEDALELALDVGRYWRMFSGYNPNATISVGVSLHNLKYPVSAMAKESGKQLDAAKDHLEKAKSRNDKDKNKDSLNISFARRPFFWKEILTDEGEFGEIGKELLLPLYRLLKGKKVSRSFLRRLLEADNAVYPDEKHPTISQVQGKVKLLYLLASAEETARLNKEGNPDWDQLFTFLKGVHTSVIPPDLSLYLNWLDLLVRTVPIQPTQPNSSSDKSKTLQ